MEALVIGLTVDQYWDLTPHELTLTFKAHGRKERATMYKLAWHASRVMTTIQKTHLGSKGKRFTPKMLMGERRSAGSFGTTAEMDAQAAAHNRKLERK